MRLIMTLLVRNEEDIIAENIRFHLSMGVDFFVVTDNGSTDSTLDILREFQERGLVQLIIEKQDDYSQSKWVSRMAQVAHNQHSADWVINNDADEFWWPKNGSLKDILAKIPLDYPVVECQRFNFKATEFKPSTPWHASMTVRDLVSLNTAGKPLLGKVCHRGFSDIIVSQGNHSIELPPDLPSIGTPDIEILHFPMRSYTQFENKISLGGAAYERNNSLGQNVGATWRKLYELYQKGELTSYYSEQLLTEEDRRVGLESGTLVHDERLKTFFYQMACSAKLQNSCSRLES